MTTARVPKLPLDEAKAAADEAAVPNYMAELSIFQVLLNHPQLARALNDLLATMLWHGALDSRLRELVIMRIGWLTACDYEWTQHWRVASGLGVTRRRSARRARLAVDTTDSGPPSGRCWRPPTTWCATARSALRAGRPANANCRATKRFSSNSSPPSARGEWSHRFCTASRSRWKRACPAGRRTASRLDLRRSGRSARRGRRRCRRHR